MPRSDGQGYGGDAGIGGDDVCEKLLRGPLAGWRRNESASLGHGEKVTVCVTQRRGIHGGLQTNRTPELNFAPVPWASQGNDEVTVLRCQRRNSCQHIGS